MKNKQVLHRLGINEESNCFFTLKDHKENFQNNPTVRLINSAKNEIGRISKVILGKINSGLIKPLKICKLVNITNQDKVIMKHTRKSLLRDNSEPCMKKDTELLEANIGAYDGAKVCDLLGTFVLYKLSPKYNKSNFVLYRNDGVTIFENISGPKLERVKRIFKNCLRKMN